MLILLWILKPSIVLLGGGVNIHSICFLFSIPVHIKSSDQLNSFSSFRCTPLWQSSAWFPPIGYSRVLMFTNFSVLQNDLDLVFQFNDLLISIIHSRKDLKFENLMHIVIIEEKARFYTEKRQDPWHSDIQSINYGSPFLETARGHFAAAKHTESKIRETWVSTLNLPWAS